MITVYLVIGRAGEAAFATWDSTVWNSTLSVPQFMWNEVKTGKTCPVTMFPDNTNWEICFWHSMFCYLMSEGTTSFDFAGSSVPEGVNFLFPYFQMRGQSVSKGITDLLHKLAELKQIPGLTMRHTSHGLKSGASDDAALNFRCGVIAIVSRANWDYSGQVSKCAQEDFRNEIES